MQKKDDKVGNKTTDKKGKEGKKESERERSKCIRKNGPQKLLRMREKPKRSLITSGQSENNFFSCKTRFYPFLC